MSTSSHYVHWQTHRCEKAILWLTLDRKDASVNSLNQAVFDELAQLLTHAKQEQPSALVIRSGKKNGFIAGADVSQFATLKDSEHAFQVIRQAQAVLDQLAALPMPTIAMISGFCLGGGCELALACTYRIALDSPATRIGLPEVKLGIHPGWGGTVRLPALVGAIAAMRMILPGASYSAAKAARIGLVDAVVPARHMQHAVIHYAMPSTRPKPYRCSVWGRLSNAGCLRPLLALQMQRQLTQKISQAHYPAPFAVVRNWRKQGISEHAYITEAQSIAHLLVQDSSRQLVRVFFLHERLKALAKGRQLTPQHIHVVGAGTMGGDIAAWCAYKGLTVTLQDQSAERIAPALKRAQVLYRKKLRKPHLVQAVMDRLQADVEGFGVKKADLVIEAIFEDLSVKQALYQRIESQLKPGAILASNTSSIPLEQLAAVLQDPTRLIGIHFFNPVAKMPLVEVVCGDNTAETVQQQSLALVGKISRLPLVVKATPGFLVNRLLMPYLMEAMLLYQEGVPATTIDQVATDFGMPMGPITLADTVGLDVCLSVAKILGEHHGTEVPEQLTAMVAAGHLGVKSQRGFYHYNSKRKQLKPAEKNTKHSEISAVDIQDRLIYRLLNEAAICLQEGIVEDADLLDAGMIFGTGFAPFRGGPINYAKQLGIAKVQQRFDTLQQQYGSRFKPAAAWRSL